MGEQPVRKILEDHRAAAALILAPPSSVSPNAASDRPELSARLESHLTHNTLVKRPFIDEGLDVLQALLSPQDALLVAPDVAELDSETVWLLDKLLQRRPEAFPSAVVGFEPDPSRTEPDDRGIVWGPFQADLASFVFNLSRLPEAEKHQATGNDVPEDELATVRQRIGDDDEALTLRTFEATPGAPGPQLRRALLEIVRHAFAGHAFEAALLWGSRVLERCPDLDPEDAAELRNVTALCAHNRQFRTTGNETLTPFLESAWRRALDGETRPALRSAVCYRLAVTLGRRQSRVEEALEMAHEAVQAARSEELSDGVSVYLEAWARNVRALLWMRLGHVDRAVDDTEDAFRLVEDARDRLPSAGREFRDGWERDLVVSGSVLVNNRIALARLQDDDEALELWQRRRGRITEDHPEFELYETAGWLHSYRQTLRLDLALEQAERGLELARGERNTLWEYVFLAHVADSAFRLGRLGRSIEACEAASSFRKQFVTPSLLESLDLLHAEALGRAGRFDAAHGVVRGVLEEADLPPGRRVEAQALSARLAASQGDAEPAEDAANAAIDAAVEHGHRDSLLLAAVAAGTASRDLGRIDEARTAYAQALELAGAGEPGDPPPPAGDVLEAHLGLCRLDPGDSAQAIQALRVLPDALTEPRGWWLLDPLSAEVEKIRQSQPSRLEDRTLAESLERLRLTSGQRADAAQRLEMR